MLDSIQIRGARVHNLKNIDLDLPRGRMIVVTGVSGSGKSSLAFDTLYAEGQRRYVESLSAYARQFLERMSRPDVDEIRGVSPAVAIEQKNPTRSSRSTVATATELHDYLRLLYARIGRTFCPKCGQEVQRDHTESAVNAVLALPDGTKIQIGFPLSGTTADDRVLELADLRSRGFYRVLTKGEVVNIDDLSRRQISGRRQVFVLVDRLVVGERVRNRLADSLDQAFREGAGQARVFSFDGEQLAFSDRFECVGCKLKFIEPQPRLFSFNNPFGACPTCNGFGEVIELDLNLVVPDPGKTLRQGAIVPWNSPTHQKIRLKMREVAREQGISIDKPWERLTEEERKVIIDGVPGFPGIRGFFRRLEKKKYKIGVRVFLSRYRGFFTCPECDNTRLRQEALNVRVGKKNIGEISRRTIREVSEFFQRLALSSHDEAIASQILNELGSRLTYLVDVGLGYLTLDRRTQTLSGGEYQRINLATAVGFKLTGSLYVLDEPSIGLHARDTDRLIKILHALRALGNTVLVVEHDEQLIRTSEHLIDLGPLAGEQGGSLVFSGSTKSLLTNGESTLTADYLKGHRVIAMPKKRRSGNGKCIRIVGASANNLKNITVEFPLACLTAVTGVSGSGKSTLIHEVLYAGVARRFGNWQKQVGAHDRIEGVDNIDDIVLVDQSPIGRSPRSNPATYTKAFDGIRTLFAESYGARSRGLKVGAFSFNTKGGRCERCQGVGVEKVEMQFLADIYLECEECEGRRFKNKVLDVKYRGKSIFDVLQMTVNEALDFFAHATKVTDKLVLLRDVGLGYLRLGQAATTLSGGEAQRLKLAAHLTEKSDKHRLFLLDEPTTGLHFHDISRLLQCLNRLIDRGNSVLIVEHNLDVIKSVDYIIDLGPEGGEEGGEVLTCGKPEEVASASGSYTGQYLKPLLKTAEPAIPKGGHG